MVKAYQLDEKGVWNGDFILVADDYTPSQNETIVDPPDGMFQPIFQGGKWQSGMTADEYFGQIKETEQTASKTDAALAALSYQVMQGQQTIAENQDTITTLQQSNAQIAYQLMTLQGGAA